MQNWTIVLLRTVIIFFLTLAIIRIIGKGSLSKSTPYEFISYTVISIIAAMISLGMIENVVFGFISLGTWSLLFFSLQYISIKSKKVHDYVNGKETVLIKDGKVMEENLIKARYTGEELLSRLRSKNAFNLSDVEFAIMESSGEINVLLKSEKKPITVHDLQRKVAPQSESQTVILDGSILDESLSNRGLNREWLNIQLSSSGVTLDNVFIGQVDSSGELYLDLFDDSIQVPQPKVKEMLYANITKAQADMISFALETDNIEAKLMYTDNSNKLKRMMDKLEPYLLR
jgi:uncharacterized membrane protein YcaP (DUF421 family)